MDADRLRLVSDRARFLLRRAAGAARLRFRYGRPFSEDAKHRLLLLSIDERIPQSQINPFHVWAGAVRDRYGAEVREVTLDRYLAASGAVPNHATVVGFQTDFDVSPVRLERLLDVIRRHNPDARLAYLDWFAPTDLRLAQRLEPHVAVYVKKHVLADLTDYGRPTLGDTNLTDFYARRFGLAMPETVFPIPPGFLDKLVVGPSFSTADFLLDTFRRPAPSCRVHRPIDLHARIAVIGTDWYRAMRGECAVAVQDLKAVNAVTGTGVGLARYLHELQASKICFSPFGYGEVCWRDFEAVANGAVLLKPDMGHIRTAPDIFVPHETYMPVKWDLSDFAEKVHLLLGDPKLREQLANRAFAVLHDYVTQARFVDQMAPMFVSVRSDWC